MASDPLGRAIAYGAHTPQLININISLVSEGAIEKQLLAYQFVADTTDRSPSLSSPPAELPKSSTIIYDLIGVPVPASVAPTFATLELDATHPHHSNESVSKVWTFTLYLCIRILTCFVAIGCL